MNRQPHALPIALVLVLVLSACAGGTTAQALPLAGVDAIVRQELAAQGVPGASVVIMKGDAVVLSRGYGMEDLERPLDVPTGDTIFAMNSMTKQITAVLVLSLVAEGRLSLDDLVRRHLPEYTNLPAGLTLRHLLSMTSGVREGFVIPGFKDVNWGDPRVTFADFEKLMRRAPLDFAPGSRWSYSNTNYTLLTLVAERLLGQPYDVAFTERFARPLRLTSFHHCRAPQTLQPRGNARGHRRDPAGTGVTVHEPERFELFKGDGGYCGSALDTARWERALATGKVVAPELYAQMVTPARLIDGTAAEYGLAMVLSAPDGARRFGHGGYGGGYSTQAAYYPDAELTVVVMLNRFAFPEYVERRIARALLGLPEPKTEEVVLTDQERARYAGSYDIGVGGWYPAIGDKDGQLVLELTPLPPLPLSYLGDGEFVVAGKPNGYRLYFWEKNGVPSFRILGMGMATWYGVKRRPDVAARSNP